MNLIFNGVGAGSGAAVGLGVGTRTVDKGVFDFVGAEVGSRGSVAAGGMNAFVGDAAGVRNGAAVMVSVGSGVLAGVFTLGGASGSRTVVDEPAGTETSTPSAVVSTLPEIVTTVVSPLGETETYESDPARITDAIPAL